MHAIAPSSAVAHVRALATASPTRHFSRRRGHLGSERHELVLLRPRLPRSAGTQVAVPFHRTWSARSLRHPCRRCVAGASSHSPHSTAGSAALCGSVFAFPATKSAATLSKSMSAAPWGGILNVSEHVGHLEVSTNGIHDSQNVWRQGSMRGEQSSEKQMLHARACSIQGFSSNLLQ